MSEASTAVTSAPTAAPTPAAASAANTPLNVVQEVRFAVVMYGGVSLAIYINGVTQELLHLVRATGYADGQNPHSGARPFAALPGLEKIYRKLAYLSGSETLRENYKQWLACAGADGKTIGAPEVESLAAAGAPLSTRFVIDILSGTSAGGINAIFLAKALSNDKQIGGLKDMWVNEGDLSSLINDERSVKDMNNVGLIDPPRSLLNSRRMYYKLLDALIKMDSSKGCTTPAPASQPIGSPHSPSPYVDELDLFVTTTDIHGVPLPIRLSDRVVYERRHRNVFHFRYASGGHTRYENDFIAQHSPFLAFAARCTSSFPFAFEPMCLADIDPVVEAQLGRQPDWDLRTQEWQRYFTESLGLRRGDSSTVFRDRPFGDGGYLDNKPFTYVTDTLARRYSNVPVRRKLLYIEPSPEHPEEERTTLARPDALENVMAALLTLPRQETIREDLKRLLDRNRLIERADRTLNQVRSDVAKATKYSFEREKRDFWNKQYLPETIDQFGIAYVPYRRMRIADATDELARCFTSQAGFDVRSDEFLAIRAIVHVWRMQNYADYRAEGGEAGLPSVNSFLDDFDLGFRVRRMTFVRRQIDLLHKMTDSRKENLEDARAASEAGTAYQRLKSLGFDYDRTWKDKFKSDLTELKGKLNKVERDLQRARAALEAGTQPGAPRSTSEPAASPHNAAQPGAASALEPALAASLASLGMTDVHLKYILGMEWSVEETTDPKDPQRRCLVPAADARFSPSVTNDDREQRAEDILRAPAEFALPGDFNGTLNAVAEALKQHLAGTFANAYEGVERTLSISTEPLYVYLWHEFLAFEDYDQVTFPILYGTDVGEAEPVEVFRVSPEDAVSVIDERNDPNKRRKLAGTMLFNFGGFLDEAWRENDVMWGRLDGAERLITSILPESKDDAIRADLIRQAHEEILADVAKAAQDKNLGPLISGAMMRKLEARADVLRMSPSDRIANEKMIANVVTTTLSPPQLLQFMRERYVVDRRLEPKLVLESISRATQVIGKMFEHIADASLLRGHSRHLTWIARFGSVFWGLVQLAVPGSIRNLMFYHWFKLLVALEAVVLGVGLVLNQPGAVHFGWLSLLITLLVGLTVTILRDMMLARYRWLVGAAFGMALVLLFFAVLGVDALFKLEWLDGLLNRWSKPFDV